MALNRVRAEANQVSVPVPAGTVSGDAVAVGELNGVALCDRGEWTTDEATIQLDGSFAFEMDGPITVGQVITRNQVNARGAPAGGGTFGHALTALAGGVTGDVEVRVANPVDIAAS